MYRVIKSFADKQDNRYTYNVGDIFPREGIKVSERRLEELSTDQNRRGIPLIQKVDEEAPKSFEEEEPKKEVPIEEAMNPPEEAKEDAPKKRGRKKNASNTN